MTANLDRRRLGLRGALLGVALTVLIAGAGPPAESDPVRTDFDPVRIRQELARVRAQLERQRLTGGAAAGASRKGRTQRDRRTTQAFRDAEKKANARISEGTRARAAQALGYRFTLGQKLAYRVEIDVEMAQKTERFSGSPVFTVMAVDQDRPAELFVVGKLSCTSGLPGTAEESERPRRAVWIGSVVTIDRSGSVGGKKDYNVASLPDFLTRIVNLKELIFTETPASITGYRGQERGATLWLTASPGSLTGMGVKTVEGTETRVLRARPLGGSLVEIRREYTFRGKSAPAMVARYESTSQFDRDRGVLLDTKATCTWDPATGSRPIPVTIRVRLLEGEELARAVDQAGKDWAERPAELDPFEFRRIRLAADSLPRLKTPAEARPGMAVAHFRDADLRWYLADVVEVVSERRYEVKVRYRGSDEVLVVNAGELGVPPAAAVAATAPAR